MIIDLAKEIESHLAQVTGNIKNCCAPDSTPRRFYCDPAMWQWLLSFCILRGGFFPESVRSDCERGGIYLAVNGLPVQVKPFPEGNLCG